MPTKAIRVPISFHSQIWSLEATALGAGMVFWNQSTAPPTPACEKCSQGWVTGGFSSTRAVPSAMTP